EEFGYAEDAAALYAGTGDWERLSRVILSQAPALIGQGRNQTLSEWIGLLPKEIVGTHPWLLYWRGACRLPFDLVQSRRDLEEAFRMFRKRSDVSGVFLAWSGVVAATAFGGMGIKPLDPWYPILEELTAEFGGFPSPQIEARVLSSLIPSLGWRTPPDFDTEKWADRALSAAHATPDVGVKVELLVHLALLRCYSNDFQKGEALLGSTRRLIKHPDVPTMVRLNASHVELVLSIFHAEFDRCLESASAALSLAEESGVHFMDPIFLGYSVLASLHREDIAEANRFLEKMSLRIDTSNNINRCFYHSVSVWIALARGDLPEAFSQAKTNEKFAAELGYHVVNLLLQLQLALIHHVAGNNEKALHHLAETRRICAGHNIMNYWFLFHLTEAFVLLGAGADSRGLLALREGFRIGRETGTFGAYIPCPGFLERLCGRALEEGIEAEYVRELIRRNRVVPRKDQRDLEAWPWPLKIYTLDRFRVIKDGSPLSFSRKVQQRPLQMLKALIAMGGRDVPEEQITDALWPDADGDQAHRSFSTTLYRLRRLIGHEKATSIREGRLTLDPGCCWVDAWAFERTVGKAEKARRESVADNGGQTYTRLAEKAIGLYKGPFLGDEEFCPRIVQVRERLRTSFLHCISELGRHWEGAGKWEQAIECYGRGLKAEGPSEEFFRRLMICYQRLGRNSEGLAVYHRCRKTLAKAFGRVPSPETEHIARELR
ncbi:MAG: BTAD domain-containing putative transcriptional regulator, partial [Candidatus Deferrimicrobiaceae bacterium]